MVLGSDPQPEIKLDQPLEHPHLYITYEAIMFTLTV